MPILSLTTPPALQLLTWEDEVETHVRVDSEEEKTRIMTVLVPAAADYIESMTNRALITQVWTATFDGFPGAIYDPNFKCGPYGYYIAMPRPPLVAAGLVISYVDVDGATQTFSSSKYTVSAPSGPKCSAGRVWLNFNEIWPSARAYSNALTITFTCGYGANSTFVPAALKQAALLLVGENFSRREEGNEIEITRVPLAVENTIMSYLVEV